MTATSTPHGLGQQQSEAQHDKFGETLTEAAHSAIRSYAGDSADELPKIAIPLRVPFARYQGMDGAGLVRERPRGPGPYAGARTWSSRESKQS